MCDVCFPASPAFARPQLNYSAMENKVQRTRKLEPWQKEDLIWVDTQQRIGEIIVRFVESKQKELPPVFPFSSEETILASRNLMYDLYSEKFPILHLFPWKMFSK